jgi:hypothetical protein
VTTIDPVDAHLAALARTLRGPHGLRRCLLAEARDGLHDAAAAYGAAGLDPARAAARAVRDFGPVREVARAYQAELAAAQARRTALLLGLSFPGLLLLWDLLWRSGTGWSGPAPPGVGALAAVQDVAGAVVGVVALAALVLLHGDARRVRDPRPLARAVAALGASAALLCAGVAVVMNLLAATATARLLTTSPLAVAAYTASAVVLVLVLRSSVRTMRATSRV